MGRPVIDRTDWQLPPFPPLFPGVRMRHVPGWKGYAVDNIGRLYSCKVERCNRYGEWHRLSPCGSKSGHLRITLRDGSRRTVRQIHQLVWEAFNGPRGKLFVLHDDGDAGNNCLDNLKLGTQRDNMLDAIRHGTHNWCHRLKTGE